MKTKRLLPVLALLIGTGSVGFAGASTSQYSPPDTAILDANALTLTPAVYIANPGAGLIDDYTLMQPTASDQVLVVTLTNHGVAVTVMDGSYEELRTYCDLGRLGSRHRMLSWYCIPH